MKLKSGISEKDDPKLVNKLILDNDTADDGDSNEVTGLAIEDDVLFVSVWFVGEKSRIYTVDISDPPRTDEVDDLLDSYTIDDYEAYGILSIPDYLFVPGNDNGEESILIIDASNPKHLFLEEKFYDLEGSDLSVAITGDYLFTTLDISDSPLYGSPASELQIFDISDPEDPDLIYSSEEMSGRQFFGTGFIAVKDNYAYVLTATGQGESRIYVYDISDPEDADLVETKKLSSGSGYELHLANDRLFVHIINQGIIEVIDISDAPDGIIYGVILGPRTGYRPTPGKLFSYNPESASFNLIDTPSTIEGAGDLTVSTDGLLYVAGNENNTTIFTYDPGSKSFDIKGSLGGGGSVMRMITTGEGIIYIGCAVNGYFVRYDPERAWEDRPYSEANDKPGVNPRVYHYTGKVNALAEGQDGTIYFGNLSGQIFSFAGEEEPSS